MISAAASDRAVLPRSSPNPIVGPAPPRSLPGDPRVETIGPCRRIIDEVSTAPLDPGRYGYVLRRGAASKAGADGGVPFLIVGRDDAPP
jgi:hypothetical protein